MRDKRTSKPQIIMYSNLVRYVEKKVLSLEGMTVRENDKFTAETKRFKITFELEKRIPDTRYSSDVLITITNKQTKQIYCFALEYDCLQWHRKWKDDKKDKVLNDLGISVIRIQTYSGMPDSQVIWTFISKVIKGLEGNVIYYRLPDFDEDVWTGKKFRDFRTGKFVRTEPVFDY